MPAWFRLHATTFWGWDRVAIPLASTSRVWESVSETFANHQRVANLSRERFITPCCQPWSKNDWWCHGVGGGGGGEGGIEKSVVKNKDLPWLLRSVTFYSKQLRGRRWSSSTEQITLQIAKCFASAAAELSNWAVDTPQDRHPSVRKGSVRHARLERLHCCVFFDLRYWRFTGYQIAEEVLLLQIELPEIEKRKKNTH